MRYPHRLRCERPGEGGDQDPDTGAWTPVPPSVVYDGAADVQDEGETIRRDAEGRPVQVSEAVAFLEDESKIGEIRPRDVAHITWEDGATADAEVLKAVRLDGKLHLRWL